MANLHVHWQTNEHQAWLKPKHGDLRAITPQAAWLICDGSLYAGKLPTDQLMPATSTTQVKEAVHGD
jgi:hypothetical protein